MFSFKAAIFFSVHVTIDTGASSNAELVFIAFCWFAAAIFLSSLDFVACVRGQFYAGSGFTRAAVLRGLFA